MDQLGPYRLEHHLATGGMADVWLATQEGPEGFRKEVVIKRIRGLRADDDAFRTMFLDEARLTARLNHPNIVQVHELGEMDGEFFVAMEYVEGCDLSEILERDRKLDWPIALHIVDRLLLALIYASELEQDGEPLDIVHRDISPSNVLLSKTGHVKLADFGVAKALSNHHRTQTGATKGKLSYMSPEQVRADPLDVRSDIFALGINIYEMVTGDLPFGDGVRALHAIQAEPYPPLPGDVPQSLGALLTRALAKDPDERFSSPEAMHDAIVEIFRNEGVHASQRDIAVLVEEGPVALTSAEIPSQQPTVGDRPATTAVPTAIVGTREGREEAMTTGVSPEPTRRPARLPWVLIGVLFGFLIAGGASTVAFINDSAAPSEPGETSETTETAGAPGSAEETDEGAGERNDSAKEETKKRPQEREEEKREREAEREEEKREREAERDEEKREREAEREEEKREREASKKRRKGLEKKVEKRLEKKMKQERKRLKKRFGDPFDD